MKKIYFLFIICAFVLSAQGQNFNLVKDINTSKDGNPANSIYNLYIGFKDNNFFGTVAPYNGSFAKLNGIVYFAADDGMHGTELWRSDNTSNGTYMVKDISPGSASSSIQSIVVAGSKLFFAVNRQIYVSDGTDAGTMAVPGITYTGDVTTCLTPVGNTLYFFTNISRLWKTDGTQAGTSLVIDFRQTYNYSKDFLGQLTNVNGTLFFTTGQDNTNGCELWKSDGTAAGTAMVKDINPGIGSSRPSNLTVINDKLYFSADDGNKISLWMSDGTLNGTQQVINNIGVSLPQISNITILDVTPFPVIKKVIYFKGSTADKGIELYKYDLNNASTGIKLVKDITTGTPGSNPSNLTAVNDILYFSVSNTQDEQQLWKSDGTNQGTQFVKNFGSGNENYLSNFAASNGTLLFSVYETGTGNELWRSNGTLNGTAIVKDIYAGNHSSNPTSFTYFNGISLFTATDGIKGFELWHTDGTGAGTQLVKNINNITTASSNPYLYNAVSLNNNIYFSAYDPAYGNNLYVSDGTTTNTHLVKNINQGNSSNPSSLTIFNNKVYFLADSAGYPSIFKTDGTTNGTKEIFSLGKRNVSAIITAAKDYLYVFFQEKDSSYFQLWILNGTSGNWQKIQNIYQSGIGQTSALDNVLFWNGSDSVHGSELWKADHNVNSVQLVRDIDPGTRGSYPQNFTVYNNKLYFTAYDTSNSTYIYKSDGTQAGTKQVFRGNQPIASANSKLFFVGYDPALGNELCVSDGTTSGTTFLADIYQGTNSSNPSNFTVLNDELYFSAYNDVYGNELWKSNGKTKGTVLVKDIYPSASSSTPQLLTTANGKLYFRAYTDVTYNLKLFVSDGTTLGTNEITDAGLNNVNVSYIKGGESKLFLIGYAYPTGTELYAGVSPGFAPQINNAVANNLLQDKKLSVFIMGNPVQNILKLAVTTDKTQTAQILVTDATGKIIINKNEFLDVGSNLISYSVNTLSAGVYNLKITGKNGTSISVKFIK